MIRIFNNPATNECKLFLVSEDIKNVAYVKVSFPELEKEFMSDKNGVVFVTDVDVENIVTITVG